MWLSRRELARILKEKKQLKWRIADLEEELRAERAAAREREAALEGELRTEREANRLREERLVDRVLTSRDAYPVTEAPKRAKPSADPTPLTAYDEAELAGYQKWATAAGYSAEVGRKLWLKKRETGQIPVLEEWNAFEKMNQITT